MKHDKPELRFLGGVQGLLVLARDDGTPPAAQAAILAAAIAQILADPAVRDDEFETALAAALQAIETESRLLRMDRRATHAGGSA